MNDQYFEPGSIHRDFCDKLKEILEYRKCNILAREE